jgi:acyl-CoA synthetase (AMP-forming)/AMP-acid ligase II
VTELFARLPSLVVDGEAVPAPVLERAVSAAGSSLAARAPGARVAVPAAGVPLVATVIAAWRAGLPCVMGRPPAGATAPSRLPDGAAAVFWTSGSTGRPRAVLLDRAAIAYQVAATTERMAYEPQDALLVPLPLTHAYGFSLLAVSAALGAGLWVESRTRVASIAERLLRGQVTTLDGIPATYRLLLVAARHSPELRRALGTLRLQGCGGDVLPPALASEYAAVIGRPLLDGYGLTEAGPNVALNGPHDARPGTVGRPLRGTDVRRDEASGELEVRSPSVFKGYVDDGPGAEAALTLDGWLRTGDLGSIDGDGYVRVAGRRKHVLIVHGETIAPTSIEEVLTAVPGVVASCVVGVRSGAVRGDDVVAFVEGAPEEAALRARLRAGLPPAMRPRRVEVLPELPRLPSGKVDRAALARRAAGLLESVRQEARP